MSKIIQAMRQASRDYVPPPITGGQIVVIAAIIFGLHWSRHGLPPITIGEVAAMSIFGAFCYWLSCRRIDGHRDRAGHERARKSVAFRLGQKLNRARRSLRR